MPLPRGLHLLPESLRSKSISTSEIVLPLIEALEAIDCLEASGLLIFGYEGWVKDMQGRVGHGSAGKYCATYPSDLSVAQRAERCRHHLREDFENWTAENGQGADVLHFCITAGL